MSFVIRLLVTAIAIWVAALLVPGLAIAPEDGDTGAQALGIVTVALAFGLVNALLRPLITAMALPRQPVLLAVFTLVANGLLLWLAAWVTELTDYGLRVEDFWAAVLGGFLVSVVSFALSYLLAQSVERRGRATVTA
jgi:putative membrane protein